MKVLQVSIAQPYAQYRNPFTFVYAQTYPLPPKSTIIGMFQNALETLDPLKLEVSICGKYESVFFHYSHFVKGRKIIYKDGGLWVEQERRSKIMIEPLYISQRTPLYHSELFNVELKIFVKGGDSLLEELCNALNKPKKILTLGRSHDIAFVWAEFVAVEEKTVRDLLKLEEFNFLLPKEWVEKLGIQRGISFLMPKEVIYEVCGADLRSCVITPRKNISRKVVFTEVYYLEKGRYVLKEGIEEKIEFANGTIPLFWW